MCVAAIVAVYVAPMGVSNADVVEQGDLNIIDDPANPSDGLRYLDTTYSNGLTLAAALATAQAAYPDARLATPSEWDDLFAAAGIAYDGAETASDAFMTGALKYLSDGTACGALRDALALTSLDATILWSDPDGSASISTTRDYLGLNDFSCFTGPSSLVPPQSSYGWLIVTEIPEPGTLSLLALGGLAMLRRKRN